ncbi:MAG: methyltransferase domain-containing protein [Rhodobacteraceae bacterium]|nr:methyltransferase domain-containing protein [Paracoccaceae bacterium]
MGSFLDKAYGAKTADEVRRLYDDWSASYEDEIGAAGYATPVRVAEALAEAGAWFTEPVLDFGCGTGLGGKALYDIGFDVIDGVDISAEMLARAEAKGLYRTLTLIRPDDPPPEGYGTIAAIGVIGPGAGPIDLIDRLLAALAPGGLLAFSLNDHALSHLCSSAPDRPWPSSPASRPRPPAPCTSATPIRRSSRTIPPGPRAAGSC